MEILKGTSIGEICVTIYETLEGKRLFKINADNEDILPVVDVIEDTLKMY